MRLTWLSCNWTRMCWSPYLFMYLAVAERGSSLFSWGRFGMCHVCPKVKNVLMAGLTPVYFKNRHRPVALCLRILCLFVTSHVKYGQNKSSICAVNRADLIPSKSVLSRRSITMISMHFAEPYSLTHSQFSPLFL